MNEQDILQLVSFELGKESFCVPITKIQEIIRYTNVVRIPKAPEFIEGIINLRGRVIPVIDLKKRFGMASDGDKHAQSRVIVAEISGVRVGLSVDSVSRVIRMEKHSFESAPAIISGVEQRFISGVVKEAKGMLIVLDLDKIFTSEETTLLKAVN